MKKNWPAALVALFLGVVIVSLIISVSKAQTTYTRQQVPGAGADRRGTIAWYVKRAKATGKNRVSLLPVEENPAGVTDLKDALSRYTVVVAKPAEKRSYIANEDSLVTWNKFQILEVLSQPPTAGCANCLTNLVAPPDMTVAANSEFLIPTNGGHVTVDGVEVISEDKDLGEHFLPSQKYLLFLSLNNSKEIGKLNLGQYGVFTVDATNRIQPITTGDDPLRRQLEVLAGNSLSSLKEVLKKIK